MHAFIYYLGAWQIDDSTKIHSLCVNQLGARLQEHLHRKHWDRSVENVQFVSIQN